VMKRAIQADVQDGVKMHQRTGELCKNQACADVAGPEPKQHIDPEQQRYQWKKQPIGTSRRHDAGHWVPVAAAKATIFPRKKR
jgi:hypothetical protein